jgi:ubiquinone/menaquinone biosynthesis C-methylase UbiE
MGRWRFRQSRRMQTHLPTTMTNDATERVREDWDSQASKWYEQRSPMLAASRPIHEWLVQHLEPSDGLRVLEIAAGPGDTGFLAAERLGAGRLVSTDLAPSMVDAARRRGAELGVTNADYQVLDAQAMDLGDASFDGVICRWGFMLMPDPAAAFRECRRVLVPGGRLVFAVFTGPDENPFASIPARILVAAAICRRRRRDGNRASSRSPIARASKRCSTTWASRRATSRAST